jgi:FkbM family methyltransferase
MPEANQPAKTSKPSVLKRAARKVARLIYRMALPVLRPLAFRTRRYLTQGMQDELNHVLVLTHAVKDNLQRMQQELTHEILANARQLRDASHTQEQEWVAGLHQAVQHARESLRGEVQHVRESLLEEGQRARESLREELFRALGPGSQELQAVIAGTQAVLDTANKSLDTALHTVDTHDARLERIEQYTYASARRVAVHCDQGTVLIKTAVGYVLCNDSDHAVLANLIDAGELEPGTRLLIERFLKPGDVFVDVGANLGMISLAAAHAMQGKGKIFAFEPFDPTRALLEKTFWLNGLSDILESHGAAVSSQGGRTRLFLGATSGHHSIFPLETPSADAARYVDVPLVTLDDALPHAQEVTLLKIDAEGAEIDVINGAVKTQANNPDLALIVEFGASHLRRAGHLPDQWLSAFGERGFKYRAIHPESGVLEDWSPERLVAVDSVNLFFAQRESRAWARLEGAK